ncbi:Bgt-2552 [Blumeria graminis f. sp. tritici]|uniref:Bgt-2552 n=3 Tax=Blumeria graminis TaxID=34373 RepID=A0A381L446_BLUGR|nr:Uncharacterized protein family UPF0183 [Blumeria graminis f. sp. tritici 96224]VCU39846.1 Bgt-2552 [Blumeria graminis f. sp. tritici]
MSLFTAQIFPGQALGFLVLGSSLYGILTRLKAEPNRFKKIDLLYNHDLPVTEPVILNLPVNGLRLRFDGPEQRLRLIEVLDFTKSHLTYKDKDVLRPNHVTQAIGPLPGENASGPNFRHIYNRLFGPTFPGEFIEPEPHDVDEIGTYVLSYPGIAFSFPLPKSKWSPNEDCVSLLSSSTSQLASSMAIFRGASWSNARDFLYTYASSSRDLYPVTSKSREPVPEEVKLIRLHGMGQIELLRPEGVTPVWIKLGFTSPQDLVANLGPPDAIYRKSDQKMSIHKYRGYSQPITNNMKLHDDSTDTDQSSANTPTDESDLEANDANMATNRVGECFYNYFYHGFDVLLSSPTNPSPCPPSKIQDASQCRVDSIVSSSSSHRLVATKLVLHGNVPGSYPFSLHRRCRWEIKYLVPQDGHGIVNSESLFTEIEKHLQEEWKGIYKDAEDAQTRQRGMVLNRDWGDSPGSSCELLGAWEESVSGKLPEAVAGEGVKGLGNTTLFGFPGLVFEVLKNGTVSGVTVF